VARAAVWRFVLERFGPVTDEWVQLDAPEMELGERRVLGRSNWCDYAIADPTVSTRHAELVRVDDGWIIRDLGSLNGTRVNGWLVKEQRLRPGDTLALGGASFRFQARV
jgi:predicted component of type VI protein secretion system